MSAKIVLFRPHFGNEALIGRSHTRSMDIVPNDLASAAASARARLAAFSRDAAVANAGAAPPAARTAPADAAREAIFADALLAALHARFEEMRTVAR